MSSSQQPSQSSAERSINDTSAARLRLARLLPDTPADQLLASLEASSGSSAGELKVRGGRGERRKREKKEKGRESKNSIEICSL